MTLPLIHRKQESVVTNNRLTRMFDKPKCLGAIEYNNLTEHQSEQILRAASRAKHIAMKDGRLSFFVVSFEPEDIQGSCKMSYSESYQMPRVVG